MSEKNTKAPSTDFKSSERQIYIGAKDLMSKIEDTFTTWQPIRETNHQVIGSIIKEATAKEKSKSTKDKKRKKDVNDEDEIDAKPGKNQCTLWHGLSSATTMVSSLVFTTETDKNLESMRRAVNSRDTEKDKLVSVCGFWNNVMENDRKYVETIREQINEYKDVTRKYQELGNRIIAAQELVMMETNQEFKSLCTKGTILSDVVLGHVPVPVSGDLEKEISNKIMQGTLMDNLASVISDFDKFRKSLLVPSKEQLVEITGDLKKLLGNLRSIISKMRKIPGQEDQADSEELLNNLEEEIIEWYVQRKRASEELHTIIKQLNKHQAKTHKARTSGKITLTIGYVLDVIGGILIPVTFGGSIGLMAVGVSLSVAGHGTDSAALAIHKKMTKQLCEAAVEILTADKEKVNHITELLDDYRACMKAAKGVHKVSDVRDSLAETTDEDLTDLKIIPILKQMESKSPEDAAVNLANQMAVSIATPSLERNLDELIEFVRTKGPSLLAQEFGLAQGKLYVPSSFEIGIIVHAIITSLESITQKTNEHQHDDSDSVFSDNSIVLDSGNKPIPVLNQTSVDSGVNLVGSVTSDISENVVTSVQKERPVPKPRKSKAKTEDEHKVTTEHKVENVEQTPPRPIPAKRRPQSQPRRTLTSPNEEEEESSKLCDFDKLKSEITSIIADGISDININNTQNNGAESVMSSKEKEESNVSPDSTSTELSKDIAVSDNDAHTKIKIKVETEKETELKSIADPEVTNTDMITCSKEQVHNGKNEVTMLDNQVTAKKSFGIAGGGIDMSYITMYETVPPISPGTQRMRLSDCFDDEDSQSTSGQTLPESSKYQDIRERAKPTERLNRLKDLMKGLKGKLLDNEESASPKSHQRKGSNISYVHDVGVKSEANDEGGSLIDESEIRNSKGKSKFNVKMFKRVSSNNSMKDESNDQVKQTDEDLNSKEPKSRKLNVKNIVQSIPSKLFKDKTADESNTNTSTSKSENTEAKQKESFGKLLGKFKQGLVSRFGQSRDDLDDIESDADSCQPLGNSEVGKSESLEETSKINAKEIMDCDKNEIKTIEMPFGELSSDKERMATSTENFASGQKGSTENKHHDESEKNSVILEEEHKLSNKEKLKHAFHGISEKISKIGHARQESEESDDSVNENKAKTKGLKKHLNLKGLRNKFKKSEQSSDNISVNSDVIDDKSTHVAGSSLSISDNEGPKDSKPFFKGLSSKFQKRKDADSLSVASTDSSEIKQNKDECEKSKKHKNIFKGVTDRFKTQKDHDHESKNDNDEENKTVHIKDFVKGFSSKFHKKKKDTDLNVSEVSKEESDVSASSLSSNPQSPTPTSPQSPTSPNHIVTTNPPDKPQRQFLYQPNEFAYLNAVIPPVRHSKTDISSPKEPTSPQITSSSELTPDTTSETHDKTDEVDLTLSTRPKSVVLSCQWPKKPVFEEKSSSDPVADDISLGDESDDIKDISGEKKKESFGTKLARLSLRKKKKSKEEKKKQAESLLSR